LADVPSAAACTLFFELTLVRTNELADLLPVLEEEHLGCADVP